MLLCRQISSGKSQIKKKMGSIPDDGTAGQPSPPKQKRSGALGQIRWASGRIGSLAFHVGTKAVGEYVWPGVQRVFLSENDKRRIQDLAETWGTYDFGRHWWDDKNLPFVLAAVCLLITVLAAVMKALNIIWRGFNAQRKRIPVQQIATLISLPSLLRSESPGG